MTQDEFIEILDEKGYSYEIEGDKIIVTGMNVSLNFTTSLPPGVVFKNVGYVWLEFVTSLPPEMVFNNGGDVYLNGITSISPDVVFKNRGDVYLRSLTGNWFSKWGGNIEGIASNKLLNVMIKQGVFQR